MDDLLAEFLAETAESVAQLDLALVRLEQAPGDHATLSMLKLISRLEHIARERTEAACGLPVLIAPSSSGNPAQPREAGFEHHVRKGERDVLLATLAGQLCAVPVPCVRDVLAPQMVTPVPLAPPEIAGSLSTRCWSTRCTRC